MLVFIIAAVTADGLIAGHEKQLSTNWTSEVDRKFFQKRTEKAGVVVMGRKTFETVGRPLPGRLNVVYTKRSEKLRAKSEKLVRFTSKEPQELIRELEKENFQELAICGGASIYTMFMKAGVVDRLYLTVEPVIFGRGIGLFKEPIKKKLKLLKVNRLSRQTLLLEFGIMKEQSGRSQ